MIKRLFAFICLYIATTFLIIPPVAKYFGKEKLPSFKSGILVPQTFLTSLFNRNYVTSELAIELKSMASEFNDQTGLKLVYLDANFPFVNGFPLLPHLSHDDGKKIDLSFIYNQNGQPTNLKPSTTGYGVFVEPRKDEANQTDICKKEGQWFYGFTKYFTLGKINGLEYNQKQTKKLIQIILSNPKTEKIFIEPHLKSRLNLNNEKIRFQGYHSVRHDDHIHLQVF